MTANDLTVVEICAGAGGQSLGLHRAGFHHRLAVELDETAAATLKTNLGRLTDGEVDVRVGDVADPDVWKPRKFEGVDLLAGGVPCPPFSIAGKQLGSQDERDLFAWAVEQVAEMKPRALLLENVRGLSMPRFSGYRQAVADRLEEFGYWSEWRLLHANNHGVVQLRPRFVLVAMSFDDAKHFHWPDEAPTDRTVGTELHDLMAERGWRYADAWAEAANDIAPTIVGGSKKHGGADLGPTRAKRAWAALAVDGHGVADAAPARRDPSFRTRLPRLTNEMVARIQGWGRPGYEWGFLGRKTSVYRQIGNAFPPPVAEAIGRGIADALDRRTAARELENAKLHDELYALLRDASVPVTEGELLKQLGDRVSADLLDQRLDALRRDFDVETHHTGGVRAFSLGGFRAFRGQAGHARNDAFAEKRSRSRVS
jgi:DNA (cytosine-5)-methyltransferase 1